MVALKRFMAGEPMKPATKRFSGLSYNPCGLAHCWGTPALRTATR